MGPGLSFALQLAPGGHTLPTPRLALPGHRAIFTHGRFSTDVAGTVGVMRIPVEAVQVQLVNSWWEQVLPVAALLISLFSVALTLLFRYFDRLNLAVAVHWAEVPASGLQPFTGQDRVTVEVTNRSRTATTEVSTLTLRSNEKKALGQDGGRRWHGDSVLPISLGPGQSASISYSAASVGATLLTKGWNVEWVQAMAVSGHKTVLGSKHRALVSKLRDYSEMHPAR